MKFIIGYFILYMLVGTSVFANSVICTENTMKKLTKDAYFVAKSNHSLKYITDVKDMGNGVVSIQSINFITNDKRSELMLYVKNKNIYNQIGYVTDTENFNMKNKTSSVIVMEIYSCDGKFLTSFITTGFLREYKPFESKKGTTMGMMSAEVIKEILKKQKK